MSKQKVWYNKITGVNPTNSEIEEYIMNLVKRATVGQIVKADITGFNNWVVGRIASWTDKKITLNTSREGGIECDRSIVYKATAEELAEFEAMIKSEAIAKLEAMTKPNKKSKVQPETQQKSNEESEVQPEETTFKTTNTTFKTTNTTIDTKHKPYEITACASGRLSKDNGDYVATTLRGLTLEQVYYFVAETLEVTTESLKTRYKHLNPGHQRMCLGNKLRGFKADAK